MFRRKEDGTEDLLNTTTAEDTSENKEASAAPTIPTSAVPAFATSSGAANYRAATTATPTSTTPTTPTSSTGGTNVTDITRGRFEARPTPTNASDSAKPTTKSASNRVLTVGNDILLKGEITTCDRLVIEGAVDATLKDVHTMEITETGSFKGVAQVQEAEISGTVEGDLNVTGRLIIYSTGKVSGNVTYGEIEIERGGKLSGEIKTQGKTEAAKKAA